MKNISLLLAIGFILSGLVSCVSRQTADRITSQKDSLALVSAQKDSILNDVFASLAIISENLDSIKSRENIVSAQSVELSQETRSKISEDIFAIDQLLIENRTTIKRLENSAKELRQANVRIAQLDRLVASLNSQINQKDKEISSLKSNLEKMNFKVDQLNSKVVLLNRTVENLDQQKNRLEAKINNQTERLNRAYFIAGTAKELLAEGIITKSGFLKKTYKVDGDYNADLLKKIDISSTKGFKINHKKIAIASTHPSDSYELIRNTNGIIEELRILDATKFWSSSKLLVIICK